MLEVLFGLDKQDQNRLSSTLTADSACLYALHNLYQKEATMATSNWTKRQTPMQYNMAPQQSTRCNATYQMLARCVLLSNKLIQQTKMTIIHQNANAKKKYIADHCTLDLSFGLSTNTFMAFLSTPNFEGIFASTKKQTKMPHAQA